MSDDELNRAFNISNQPPEAQFLSRYETILGELDGVQSQIKALAEEAKQAGLNPTQLKRAARLRMDRALKAKFESQTMDLFSYMRAAGTPLEIEE